MKVEQLMSTDLATCAPDENLNEAVRLMWERDCGFLPITEQGTRRVVGTLTDRDACMAAYTRGRLLTDIRVEEVMARAVQTCRPGDPLAEAEAVMRRAQVHRLPVVDESEQLVGVISLADIAQEAARGIGARRPKVTTAELGETIAAIRQPRVLPAS